MTTEQPSPPAPVEWLCPVCGAVVADELLTPGSPRPPLHEHHGHSVAFIPRAQL